MIPFREGRFAFVLALIFLISLPTAAQVNVFQKRLDGPGESVGINPINPYTIYGQDASDKLAVSRNQGKTWTSLPASVPSQIRQIIVHPKDTLTIFITDFFNGLWRSTNGGSSWTIVISPFGIDGESVAYDPSHPDTMYAGNFGDGTVYRSTNRGATWSVRGSVASNLCSIAIRPDSSNILLAGSGSGRISKSTNGGTTWYQVKTAGSTEIPKIVINHTNPQIAYGSAYEGVSSVLGVWKTTNGGESWFRTALQNINIWAIDIDQSNPDVVYAGTFSVTNAGMYKSTDAGATWAFNNNGIQQNYSFWNIHVDPINTSNVYTSMTVGAFGDNGVYRFSPASEGIAGFVRDSLTNAIITTGTVNIQPVNETINLASSGGAYSYYRLPGDTSTSQTFSVTINSFLIKQQTIAVIADSIRPVDLLVPPGSIGGTVFNDQNNNGARDSGEVGLSNWTINLTGQASASALSDVNGAYVFADLLPGNYTVSEQSKNGWTQTAPVPPTFAVTVSMAQKDHTGKDFGNRLRHAVVAVTPSPYQGSVLASTSIQATFDTAMTPTTFNDTTSWLVYGKQSGRHRGTFSFNGAQTVATFTPEKPFQQGEGVVVDLTSGLEAEDGFPIAPYNYQFSIGSPAAPGSFVGRSAYQVGSGPWGIAAADLDGDGDNDLVTANSNVSTVSVLKNGGYGTFAPKTDYATGSSPIALSLADVDRDGDLDILTANNGSTSITVLRNAGNGTFPVRNDYSVTFAPFSVDVADMNGDGHIDLVTGGPGSGSISVMLNDGSGAYPSHQNFPVANSPWSSVLGDLDNDGTSDVASTGGSLPSSIEVFGNLGNGTLGSAISYTVANNARAGQIADATGDGLPDLLATNSGSTTVSLLPKNGSSFGPAINLATGTLPWGVVVGDMTGDGLAEIVVANTTSKTVSVFRNLGSSSFARTDYPSAASPRFLALADLDQDGDLDLAASNSGTDSVSVYLNSGSTILATTTGWNLLSLPVEPRDHRKSVIYPSAVSSAFIYTGSYTIEETLSTGSGYWIKFSAPGNTLLRGDTLTLDSIDVRSGWNLVGALTTPIDVGVATTVPPAILVSNFYSYDGAYHVADSLIPGNGYWIKTSQAGKIVISTATNQPAMQMKQLAHRNGTINRLTLRDAGGNMQELAFLGALAGDGLQSYEMPPRAPGNGFDARFASGRILEGAGSGEAAFPVALSGAEYPVTVSWTIHENSHAWSLVTGADRRTLRESGSIIVRREMPIVLQSGPSAGGDLPHEFALRQNYPNPFNPVTTIRYELAGDVYVSLKVYNILGEEVADLVEGTETAGMKAVAFDAAELPSGVYTVRLVAGSFTGSKKMLLMK